MALVAINAVVDVAAHILMVRISSRLGMAIRALEDGVVTRTGVAGCTNPCRVTVVSVEPSMVEGCARPPGNNLMAGLAGGRESRSNVIRVVCGLVYSFVARVTISWKRGVVVVHMAVGTLDGCMRAHQREGCVVVVERSRLPRGRAVANVALLRESARDVIGIGCRLIVLHVAAHARRAGQVIVPVLVAIAAHQLHVPAREGEAALGMVE